MKKIFTLLFAMLILNAYTQQKHFSLSMALRMQSDSIFCDLIAKDDLPIVGFQMGFHHNSDDVEFMRVQQASLPGVDRLKFNEVCPKYVRMLWTKPDSGNHQILRGDVLFTLVYRELNPTNHFICMMPSSSSPPDNCKSFGREAFDFNFSSYIVDDVCINYEIVNGQAIILSSSDERKDQVQVNFNDQNKSLIIGCDAGFSNKNMKLQITAINGADCFSRSLNSVEYQSVDLSNLPSGLYYYKIANDKRSLSAGKIVLK